MIRTVCAALSALSLFACSASNETAPVREPPAPNQPGRFGETVDPNEAFVDAANLEVVTDFLYPDMELRPEEGALPVGVLLLSASQPEKNDALCDGYLRDLRTYAEANDAEPDTDFLVTYWPLKEAPPAFNSCDMLMGSYDFLRASQIRTLYGLSDVAGPVILAVDEDGNTVFLDLTDASKDAARTALHSWLSLALEDDPALDAPGEVGAGASRAASAAGRLTLKSFSGKIKTRLMADSGAGLAVSESQLGDGRTLFAYKDPSTGYRIGSTIRF